MPHSRMSRSRADAALVALLFAALFQAIATASVFDRYTDCTSCISAGFGWQTAGTDKAFERGEGGILRTVAVFS